uniref:FAD synthase n=3 Tax=Schistosoma mansoni TaxID=6183 RepID=A0AA51N0W8_SCHMA|nr:flavin adenine dinucleotide synthetase [Schistosoma mansoni]
MARCMTTMSFALKMVSPKSLGLIVIGDEILNGKAKDSNSRQLCLTAPLFGVRLRKISVIPDDSDAISEEVRNFMNRYDYVITSGGIGSTHDDVTYEGVAKALNEKIIIHPKFLQTLRRLLKPNMISSSDPMTKLAKIPESSELLYATGIQMGSESSYPIVKVKNIFILPGVPCLFNMALEIIKDHIRDPNVIFFHRSLYLTTMETEIAKDLSRLAEKYQGVVSIGSYPAFHNNYYRVRIAFDSLEEDTLKLAYKDAECLFKDYIIQYNPYPIDKADEEVYKLCKQTESNLGKRVAKSLQCIEEALNKYSDSELVICFNGGKDCTALLHLIHAAIQHQSHNNNNHSENIKPRLPKLLYIRSCSSFPETELFVEKTVDVYYSLSSKILRPDLKQNEQRQTDVNSQSSSCSMDNSVVVYEGSIKSALERFLGDYPEIRGAFMGTRYTDPGAYKMSYMVMSDPGWPQILRINPLLEWTYSDVWNFLRSFSLPYCSLYDAGYTSIGSMEDTHPNPQLRYITESGRIAYHPAYTLDEEICERIGRVHQNTKTD